MSKEKENKKIFTQQDVMKVLDACYQKSTHGIKFVSPPVEELAQNYLDKKEDKSEAAKCMIKNQIKLCTTSGFITGFGGIITLPVSIPANIGSVLYLQMRMIACTAYIAGYDTDSDQVKTLVYACLAGVAVNQVIKKAGISFGQKFAVNLIKKIPGEALIKINQKVGFRFLTKFGAKGIINLGKLLPGVGGVINGGFDLVETKVIGGRAYKWFFENDFSVGSQDSLKKEAVINDDIIDVDSFIKE